MASTSSVWTVKYKPRTLTEVVGNKKAIEEIVSWVKLWDAGAPRYRALLLSGPPGIGKTVSVEALVNDLNLELVEKNASDYRTEKAVTQFAGQASHYGTLFGNKRLVLFDELDGITGRADRGGVGALTRIIKTAQCPIVVIANDAYDPRFSTLRYNCLLVKFRKPPVGAVMKHLKRICEHERILADEAALRVIAQRSEGDIRSAVNDLQALAQGKQHLTFEDVSWLAYRDRKEAIFNVLRLIFYGKTAYTVKRAVDIADVNLDMLFEWIYENLPYHLRDPNDLAKAMDSLAKSDLYRGRIKNSQNWSFTRYVVDFMTAGVAIAREKTRPTGFVPLRFPERIKFLSKTRSERQKQSQIGLKIAKKCHISAARAIKEILPFLCVIFESNPVMAAKTAKWLDLDREMIIYLTKTKKQTEAILNATLKK